MAQELDLRHIGCALLEVDDQAGRLKPPENFFHILFMLLHGGAGYDDMFLRKGYYQIPMHPADMLKTAIITPFGLFEFLRLTFGLRNAGSTLQRLMDRVLAGVAFAFVYLDDFGEN
jgi:hypothetical protein